MPTDPDPLETAVLTPGTTTSAIIALLYRHPEHQYSRQEIRTELEISATTALAAIDRLHTTDHIQTTPDGTYRAHPDRTALFRYTAALDGLDRLFRTDEHPETTDATDADLESADLSTQAIENAVDLVETTETQGQ
ncbi:hypothetical protein SAMN05216388_10123 [Halorientalis persicus]|uniref:MarR family protein n=1 Tax=Halorientalis persicus TaxID=1367881 RepID=A0A1H8PD98_9EURY|nr:hypothetical protein [Halorientalis persicus]SEO39513.1 hypothetical protein SAMN05216388_10123 [Halorientalis persicus]